MLLYHRLHYIQVYYIEVELYTKYTYLDALLVFKDGKRKSAITVCSNDTTMHEAVASVHWNISLKFCLK